MKTFSIIAAIVCSWASGVGASAAGEYRREQNYRRADHASIGALVLLAVAIASGVMACRL